MRVRFRLERHNHGLSIIINPLARRRARRPQVAVEGGTCDGVTSRGGTSGGGASGVVMSRVETGGGVTSVFSTSGGATCRGGMICGDTSGGRVLS